MKRNFFISLFVAIICCQFSYGQRLSVKEATKLVDEYYKVHPFAFETSNETEDEAYDAPNSAITKRWYFCPKGTWHNLDKGYIEFKANGTFICFNLYKDQKFHSEITGTWKRIKTELNLTFNYNTAKCIADDMSGLSNRQKDESNQVRLNYQAYLRKFGIVKEKRIIGRLNHTMQLFLMQGQDTYNVCGYLISEEELTKFKDAEKKLAEEEKAREEEQEKKAKEERLSYELQSVNERAYAYAYEGKYNEAIATINTAIEKQPSNPNWYDSKGEFLYMKGDKEGAKAMWNKAISLDPDFRNKNTSLGMIMSNQGWQNVNDNFPKYIPFKKIRVRKVDNVPGQEYCVFFTTSPNMNSSLQDTDYKINYYMNLIYNGNSYSFKKFKKCTDVGDGWFEYEYSQYVYFSHYQRNAPRGCLKILIE